LLGIKVPTFLECFLSVIGIGGVGGSSTVVLGPAGVRERKSVFLLPRGVARFFILGVFGEFDTFAVIFAPLAVFLSIHITLS
jgi:hypothetical protein